MSAPIDLRLGADGFWQLPTEVAHPLLLLGDCWELLRQIPANSVHAYVSDPPAAIDMMQREWDRFADYVPHTQDGRDKLTGLLLLGLGANEAGFIAAMFEVWVEVRRVVKPGGYIVAWALPKTSDLAGMAMRLAGLVPDNPLLHLFATGMAKGENPSKRADKIAGAERDVVGTKLGRPGMAADGSNQSFDSSEVFGSGGTLSSDITAPATDAAKRLDGTNSQVSPGYENWLVAQVPIEGCSPERLRELTGLDYAWSSHRVKSARQRRTAARDWTVEIADSDPTLILWPATTNWGEAVRMCAALRALDDGVWTTRRGRSLRPEHASVAQVLRDGEVMGERETTPFSSATMVSITTNLLEHGCGAYNVDAVRIPRGADERARVQASVTQGSGLGRGQVYGDGEATPYVAGDGFPKNVLLSTGGESCPAAELDRQSGPQKDGKAIRHRGVSGDSPVGFMSKPAGTPDAGFGGGGGASRFYTNLPIETAVPFRYQGKAKRRDSGLRQDIANDGIALKTQALMRWIMRLVVPTAKVTGGLPGLVLSSYLGTGTDGVAAVAEGFRFVGMERDPAQFELACSRIYAAIGSPEAAAEANERAPVDAQLSLL